MNGEGTFIPQFSLFYTRPDPNHHFIHLPSIHFHLKNPFQDPLGFRMILWHFQLGSNLSSLDAKVLDGLGFKDIKSLIGVKLDDEMVIPDRPTEWEFLEVEFEHPDCVLLVYPNGIGEFDMDYKGLSLAISALGIWSGKGDIISLVKSML
ncbi:hypothetical protein POM88_022919 [Heracleum sosnowskyi]|uniref:Uncharacterized protein n=1 Tax=Heracleum sosnowskyi TaxID=360622 RepID=A0AAD8IHN7_9APIA|nr:hypothetical protein POM88_022919 [Heracleum sosnowskyi]